MQYSYTTFALAALSISSILAAPTPYVAEVDVNVGNTVETVTECVDSDLSCITKKDVISGVTSLPVVSTVAGEAGTVAGGLVGGVESTLSSVPVAGPVVAGVSGEAASVAGTATSLIPRDVSVQVDTSAVTSEVSQTVGGVENGVASLPIVGSVVSTATGNVGSVLRSVKRALFSPLAGTVVNEAGVIVGVTEEALNGAVSNVAQREVSSVGVISGAVYTLKDSVSLDLLTITSTVTGDVTGSVVPMVQTALVSLASSINTTVLTIAPVVTGTVSTLAVGEVQALIDSLADVQTIVSDIEAALVPLVSSIGADALAMVTPEVSAVLATIMPLVSPLTGFAFSVAGTVTDANGEGNAVRTAAFDVVGVASSLLSPVTGVVGSLLRK